MGYLQDGAHIHLIGVGGTGMASLAGLLKSSGYHVTGSDASVYPPMSTMLQELGIVVKTPYSPKNIPHNTDLVVIGNALSRGNPEVEETLDRGLRYESMAAVVKEVCLQGRRTLVVAGTHGKTTTTALLAWILEVAGQQDPKFTPGYLIGGAAENFDTPFKLQPEAGGFFVIEGDEYDTAFFDKGPKFMHYPPHSLILTSVEYDHADIYADLDAVKLAFRRLVNLVPASGLIVAASSPGVEDCLSKAYCPVERYSLIEGVNWQVRDIEVREEWMRFQIGRGRETLVRAELKASGEHNALNALAAVAMASHFGVDDRTLRQAVGTFKGVKRRMEVVGEVNGITVMDDFAHHPTAIKETLKGVRKRFPRGKVWAVVEPRSNTMRRRVVETDLVNALAEADRVTLAGVFQSANIPEKDRLEPGRVVTRLLREGITASSFNTVAEIVGHIASQATKNDVIVIMSNGGFDGIHEKLIARLESR